MSTKNFDEPFIIKGGLSVDDRGEVLFVNDFNFNEIRRFYTIKNHNINFVRAWHGHKIEQKYITVNSGTIMVCCVKIDNWETPSAKLFIHKFFLSDKNPSVLFIPNGYANGFMSLTNADIVSIYSNLTLEQSINDDFRFPSRFWNPWEIVER